MCRIILTRHWPRPGNVMPIPPSLIGGGLSGWSFLKSNLPRQEATFATSPDITRASEKLRSSLSEPFPLDKLMGDRQLLDPVLKSFGLGSEIDKGAFLRRIIEDGPDNRDGFARRLNNPDFIELSRTFQADPDGLIRLSPSKVDEIERGFRRNEFETSVGEREPDLRLALNFEEKVKEFANDSATDRAFWFRVIGNAPLREVFDSAFILPEGFANLDVDRQADILQRRAEQVLGPEPVAALTTDAGVETVTRRFLLQRQIEDGPSAFTPGATALALLGSSGFSSAGLNNLLLSNAS